MYYGDLGSVVNRGCVSPGDGDDGSDYGLERRAFGGLGKLAVVERGHLPMIHRRHTTSQPHDPTYAPA